jgi:endo-1,4-beta-xylanase
MPFLAKLVAFAPLLPLVVGQDISGLMPAGKYFGVFTNPDRPAEKPAAYETLLDANFNAGTDGNACKWDSLEPTQGSFNWGRCGRTAE